MIRIKKIFTVLCLLFVAAIFAVVGIFTGQPNTTVKAGTFADMTDSFVRDATQLMKDNWSDKYFSKITMTIGQSGMQVD